MGIYANGPAPSSRAAAEANWVEGRVGVITKEAGISRRTEDADDDQC